MIYRKSLKNREFGQEGPQIFDSERTTIAEGQGASEDPKVGVRPTQPKTDSSGFFGIKAVVVTGYGINCEKEMAAACTAAGANVSFIHAKKLLNGEFPWEETQLLLFPGGFSFGDELGAAKVFSNRLLQLRNQLQQFVDRGNCILGVCNGFQLLVKLGLLPGGDKQNASLACNATGRFECRWIHHKVLPSHCIFTKGLDSLYLPIRHGEGKFVAESTEKLFEKNQVVLQYEDNVNGSMDAIAAVCDPTGRILGMMAHPEAALYGTQYPQWTRMGKNDVPEFGPGYSLFKNAVEYLSAVPIRNALISVTDKTGLGNLARQLRAIHPSLRIIASGGTAQSLGVAYTPLHEYTGMAECFGGRVKTLHPKVMGGILYRRGMDDEEAKRLDIEPIDLIICNLYDFKQAAQNSEIPTEKLIEYMDIGGSTLIRSACKNYEHVAIVVDPNDYPLLLEELIANQGKVSLEFRKYLAAKAIDVSASYEALLAQELSSRLANEKTERILLAKGKQLRYGENPDQQAWVYASSQGIAQAKVLSGKELSYNNYEDATVAHESVQSLRSIGAAHAVAIVKHGNLCGFATGHTETQAFEKAWDGDTKSAFGSVIAFLSSVTEALIPLLKQKFFEVIIAPHFEEAFVAWIKAAKPNVRLLVVEAKENNSLAYKSISGGLLVQTKKGNPIAHSLERLLQRCDPAATKKIGVVTQKQPQVQSLTLFAFGIAAVNYAKSNAIAIVREYEEGGYQLLGMGSGQPNRVDSLERLALPKALDNLRKEGSSDLSACVLASDGFFPFDDSITTAAAHGIKLCVQPGGSNNDPSVIAAADANEMCMIFTGERYFYH